MSSRSRYDAFADTRYGGALLRYVLDGIDTNPSYFQRFLMYTPQNIVYALDKLGYADRRDTPHLRGYTQGYRRDPNVANTVQDEEMNGYRRWYNKSSDRDGRKTAPVRRSKRFQRVGKAARANWRVQKNLPITISHEETSEVRAKAGTQGIVQFQAERRLPVESSTNPQVATGLLVNNVNRKSDGTVGTYNGGIRYNDIYRYTSPFHEVRSIGDLTHRSDWTMFTNGSWRDGYSALNGRYGSALKLQYGYITPVQYGAIDTTDVDWFKKINDTVRTGAATFTNPVSPLQAIDYHHLEESLTVTVTNNAVMPCSVTFYECTLAHDVPIMRTKILSAAVGDETSAHYTNWGGLPCPVELWRASRKLSAQAGASLIPFVGGIGAVAPGTTEYGSVEGDDGEGAVGTRMGAGAGASAAGYTGGNLSYFAGNATVPSGTAVSTLPDVDHAGVRVGGQLLHHWYTVKAHHKTIPPGMSTTFSFKMRYNKRIPGTWWESLYGVAGLSKTFFMVTRPGLGVGSTGESLGELAGAGSRLPCTGPTDLTMKWTKHKSFCRTDMLPRRHVVYRATRPVMDVFQARNPGELTVEGDDEDPDDEQAMGGGVVGADGTVEIGGG